MKIYTLTIVYNDKDEEIESIQEELHIEVDGILEELTERDLESYLTKDDNRHGKGCYIIGEA